MKDSEYGGFDGLRLAQLVVAEEVRAAELVEVAQRRADEVNPRSTPTSPDMTITPTAGSATS